MGGDEFDELFDEPPMRRRDRTIVIVVGRGVEPVVAPLGLETLLGEPRRVGPWVSPSAPSGSDVGGEALPSPHLIPATHGVTARRAGHRRDQPTETATCRVGDGRASPGRTPMIAKPFTGETRDRNGGSRGAGGTGPAASGRGPAARIPDHRAASRLLGWGGPRRPRRRHCADRRARPGGHGLRGGRRAPGRSPACTRRSAPLVAYFARRAVADPGASGRTRRCCHWSPRPSCSLAAGRPGDRDRGARRARLAMMAGALLVLGAALRAPRLRDRPAVAARSGSAT